MMREHFDGWVPGAPTPFARTLTNGVGPKKRKNDEVSRSINHGGDSPLVLLQPLPSRYLCRKKQRLGNGSNRNQ